MSLKYYGYARAVNGEITIYDDCLVVRGIGLREEKISYNDILTIDFLLPDDAVDGRGRLKLAGSTFGH